MSSFGGGLGTVIGSSMAASDLNGSQSAVNNNTAGFEGQTAPYNSFGQSFLNPAHQGVVDVNGAATSTQSYNDFMKNYTNTPAVQYQLQQADATTNNSAAAKEQLLSGSNLRSLQTMNNGIVSQGANNAYNEYLAGNNQQFGQLEQSLGNMFQAIGVGQTATGQDAGVVNGQNSATSAIGQAQAKNDQSKGSGLGSMFSGLGSFAAAF